MKSFFYILFLFSISFYSCGGGGQPSATESHDQQVEKFNLPDDQRAFLNNLASLCGQSFRGGQVYMQPGRDSWADHDMVMHVTVCEDTHVHIPFHLDEDRSRTWMFLEENGQLRFRHDHRYEDGTPEEQTLYGGYADGSGTAFLQRFPADDYTVELLTDTLGREWNVVLDEALTTFSYRLLYHGEIVFQADFDLSNPM